MPGGLAYDDSGTLAAYFGISLLTLVLLPLTIISIRRSIIGEKSKGKECTCSECKEKSEMLKRAAREGGLRRLFSLRIILLLLGWTIFAGLAYYIYQSPTATITIYNPFEILGLNPNSDEKAIKKHYKRLSLEFHPDKIRLGPNQTQEEVDAHFVDLTKAYKSLTDEAIRDNLVKYGNPDGQQPREEMIAIPQWVVDGKNGMWALAVYGLVLAGGLPWLTGKWWNSQQSTTKDGALNESAELFFRFLREDTSLVQLIALLAGALEYRTLLNVKGKPKKDRKAHASQTEALEKQVGEQAKEMGYGSVLEQESLTTAASKRAAALIWTQLLRMDDLSPDLLAERRKILAAVNPLFASLLSMASVPRWLTVSQLIMQTQSRLVQAVPYLDYPIAQLPGVSLKDAVENSKKDAGLQSAGWQTRADVEGAEFSKEARKVAEEIPQIRVANAKFEVEGEDSITPNAQVQFVCDLSLDLGALEGEAASKDGAGSAFAHAPRWPAHRKPQWWVFIGDPLSSRIVVPPQKVSDIPPYTSTKSSSPSSSKPNLTSKTIKLQFPAPPEKCELSLKVYIVSDTYIGCDKVLPVTLRVEEPEEEDFEDEDDDISDPEEDTIAGALAMAKGQRVKSASDARRNDDESDEESGTDEDGDAGDDSSDSDSD